MEEGQAETQWKISSPGEGAEAYAKASLGVEGETDGRRAQWERESKRQLVFLLGMGSDTKG